MNRLFIHLSLFANRVSRFGVRHKGALQAVASLLALSLGFWGWMIEKPPEDISGTLSNLFRTFQLITLNFPLEIDRELSWQLQVARLAVPVVAAMATFNILVGSITRPARLALLPHTEGHIVVAGADRLTEGALKRLALSGKQIVTVAQTVDPTRRDELEGLGLTIVEADPLRPMALKALNLTGAAAMFVLHEDDLTNINIAMRAIGQIGQRAANAGRLTLVVLINQEELADELEVALDGLSRKHGLRYQRICADREALRSEMARFAPVLLKENPERPSHILIVGLSGNWQQNLMQLIVSGQDHPDMPPMLSIVATADEIESLRSWQSAKPELGLVVDVNVIAVEADALPEAEKARSWRNTYGQPDLVIIQRDDAAAMMTSLRLRRADCDLDIGKAPILVRQEREDHILPSLALVEAGPRNMANLVPFGGMIRAETIARALDRSGDERALALHEAYRRANRTAENAHTPSMAAWDDLTEGMREANRSSAAHAPIMLASIGLKLLAGQVAPDLSDAQLERLARIEHRRWCADRIERGWRFGAVRDDVRKIHPSLVPFDELSDGDREKDRSSVKIVLTVANVH
ncbi:RyR domain-containing protein [Bosea sp. R86505]|uniref:RyR domain-containing protein n=1 Tax=Bosea sp. R86505 TaxID=3101710 RepID=UPI00366ACC72